MNQFNIGFGFKLILTLVSVSRYINFGLIKIEIVSSGYGFIMVSLCYLRFIYPGIVDIWV